MGRHKIYISIVFETIQQKASKDHPLDATTIKNIIEDEAMDKLAEVFTAAGSLDDFGNGRYVRNVVEKARMAMASRLVAIDLDSVTDKDITTICPEDIEFPVITKHSKSYGFCA